MPVGFSAFGITLRALINRPFAGMICTRTVQNTVPSVIQTLMNPGQTDDRYDMICDMIKD